MRKYTIFLILLTLFACSDKTSKNPQEKFKKIENTGQETNSEINIITEEYPPYNYTEDGILMGFSVEIVRAIMKELDVEYPIAVLPGARGEHYTQNNPNFMLFSLYRTKKRESVYKWIGPITNESNFFFKRKGDTRIFNTMEDAKKVNKISARHEGMVLNFLLDEGFNNLNRNSNIAYLYELVVKGKADLIANPASGVKYRLKKFGYPEDALVQTNIELFNLPLYIACSKDMDDKIIGEWQQALDRIKESGEYERIYADFLK